MKITLIRGDRESGKEALSTCEADAWMDRIKTETKEEHVTRLRTMLLYTTPDSEGHYEHIDKLPRVYPSVEYGRTRDSGRKLKHYNGVVMLEVNNLAGLSEVELVKRQAALLPQTWAVFAGSSGQSVKIWIKFALPDGKLPVKEENIEAFHAHAYRMAVQCYQPILPFPITLRESSPTQSCRMTLDAYPYFNPQAIPFCLEQPFGMPGEETFHQRQLTEKNPLLRLKPGYETSQTCTLLFETALGKAMDEMDEWKRGNDLQQLLACLAEHCFKAGIPEEETVRQVMIHYFKQADEQTVRSTIRNLYRECKGFGKRKSLTPEQDTAFRLNEFMERRYEFRFNALTSDLEYRWFLNMVAHWRGLDKLHSNSTSPLLVGAQGFRKSTYCRIILPPELRFGYTDSLDFKSKRDAELYLGRFMLINIDEFDQVSINQQGFLKHLLQKPVANLRKPYGSSIQEMRRYASFIGTSNQKDLLTDPSGSRRFICIEVTAPIDTNVTINYRQLYAQAMEAIVKGERYWFDDADEAILHETNREFEQISPVEQLFHCYFRSPEEGEEGEYLSPMQILEHLRSKNRDIKLTASNVNHFGRILRKNNLEYKRTCKGIVYRVEKL